MKNKINSILIANRGEIASRIIKTCQQMGITSIAVYSDIDKSSNYVIKADQAYYLGGNQPSESYLNIDKIISIAKKVKVDAIHPGYGFLSENVHFAKRCEKETAWFSTSEMWDDGVIDPRQTRNYLGFSLAVVYSQPIKGTSNYGVFRM